MKLKLSLLITLIYLLAINSTAQLTVYKTYEDYKNNAGHAYGDSYDFSTI